MFLFSKPYLEKKRYKIVLISLSFLLIIVGTFIFINPPEKYKESSDLVNIESYMKAQDIYSEIFKSHGTPKEIGFSFGNYGKVYENISLEQAKEIGLNLNQPIFVNKDLYRVIIEITDCKYNAKRFWLIEKRKIPLKLKSVQYECSTIVN